MCGIAGYVDFSSGGPDERVLAGMAGALGRRGPDGRGVAIDGPCGLAHARLSVIDLEGGSQPMRFEDCGVALVYNGETYNFAELRTVLTQYGERLHTVGDTEVV